MTEAFATTVLGPVPARELGVTLTHEHCLIDLRTYWNPPIEVSRRAAAESAIQMSTIGASRRNPFFARDNLVLDDLDDAIRELTEFKKLGGGAVVDLTPPDIGRDPVALQIIARQTGLHIVAGCGHYIQISHPSTVLNESVESISERLTTELQQGIDDSGIRPGIIGEVGTSNPIHPSEEKVLRAAARAHKATGVPIAVHLSPPPSGGWWKGAEVLDILEAGGVMPGRVLLSHLDNALGPDEEFQRAIKYHKDLARRGCFIGYDGCGKDHYFPSGSRAAYPSFWCPSDRERAKAVALLADAGFADRLLLSHDVCFRVELVKFGGFGYGHMLRTFTKNLQDYGISAAEHHRILTENPRALLAVGV